MTTLVQRSLARGEVSPGLRRRADLDWFRISLRTMRNAFVPKGGGGVNRAGTTYIYGDGTGETIGSNAALIPWESPSSGDSYVLEVGWTSGSTGFIRFVRDGTLIRVSSVTAWSAATAYVVGDLASRLGVNYYCILAHTNQQPPNATYWHALTSDVYTIPTPFIIPSDLGFVQDSSLMTFVGHSGIYPRDLYRTSDTNWILRTWSTESATGWGGSGTAYGLPRINAPTNLAASDASTGPTDLATWAVTAVTEDGEESLYASVQGALPTSGDPNEITWSAATFRDPFTGNVKGYNIYRKIQSVFYYLGFTTGTSYIDDDSVTPNPDDDSPPEPRAFELVSGYTSPKKIGTFQQRLLLGNFQFNIQQLFGSKIGFSQNFSKRFPAGDDDSIRFQLKGKRINGIRHIVDIGALVIFTDSGEWVVEGNAAGALTPTDIYPKQYSYNGASETVAPVVIGSEVVYVQAQGSVIRSLGFDNQSGGLNGYRDTDMTVFSEHLFKGYTITGLAYQKTPHSILWAVRSDGVLLGCTYIKEQQIFAWHKHDTDGTVEKICSIPENNEHALYMIVKRNIDGSDVRYMERLNNREFDDIVDAVFLDSAATYDGRNETAVTMTLSGGTTWAYDETLTLTASSATFASGDVGNEFWLTGSDDIVYRCEITAYTDTTHVSVRPDKTITVASGLRGAATTNWAEAVDEISGLDHLEGEDVAVFANGYVVANPNNPAYTTLTVASGAITLPECYSVVHVGLPYLSDIETQELDSTTGTIMDRKKLITSVAMDVEDTRGLWAGREAPTDDDDDPLEDLYEMKLGNPANYSEPPTLVTDTVEINIKSKWNSNGRVLIRQVDPLPFTILSIAPQGLVPGGG